MAKKSKTGYQVREIVSEDGSVRAAIVPELGAIVSSLRFNGREILFQHDFFWDADSEKTRGGVPLLFPICGRLERNGVQNRWVWNRHIYSMPIHGFAMRMPWRVLEEHSSAHELAVELRDTEGTRAQYPFEFRLSMRMSALQSEFVVRLECENTGQAPMPYYAGFHPYFLTPQPGRGKEQTLLHLKPLRRVLYNATLTDVIGEAEPPAFPVSVADPAINEMLALVGSEEEALLEMPDKSCLCIKAFGEEIPDLFPYIQLYTMPEKPFFCVEPWMSYPNAMNTVDGPRWLGPGCSESGIFRIAAGHDRARPRASAARTSAAVPRRQPAARKRQAAK